MGRSGNGAGPALVRGDAARAALLRGVGAMTALLRPTLGPTPRTVAVGRLIGGDKPPEILDSAATIARRTIELGDPFENMGAMLVRHLVDRVHERAGDGGATAAVVAEAILREGARYVAAGGAPGAVVAGIRRGRGLVLAELRRQARPVDGPADLARIAANALRDERLAEIVGEVLDSVGTDGSVLVELADSATTTHEYTDGLRWDEGFISPYLLEPGEAMSRLVEPRILLTDRTLARAEDLLPAIEACVAAGEMRLVVIAPEVRDDALALLVLNRQRGVLDGALAVRAPSIGAQRTRILEDMAAATGGRAIRETAGERLADVTPDHLGRARQVWATRAAFGILGGRGDRETVRRRLAEAKAELQAGRDDPYTRDKLRERIGKLAGAAAIIRVGAPSISAQEELKQRVESALGVARLALEGGAVPGGGAGLLACARALDTAELGGDEAVGLRALARALESPLRAVAANAGLDPAPILAESRRRGPSEVFDAVAQRWVNPWRAGIVDPLPVLEAALDTAVSAATMALTTDALVHRSALARARD